MSVGGQSEGHRLSLEGKVAVITGGASGIGLATARRLSASGALIVVVDLAEDKGERLAAELGACYVPADVGDPADWDRVVAEADRSFGGIDLAFLNAGVITPESDVTAVSDESYRRIVSVNLDGVFFGVRAVVPSIEARGGGAIVTTASLAGLISYSPDPVYAMTEHAVVGLVRALAPQLQAKGITINAICPGLVDTPLLSAEAKAMAAEAGFPLIPATDIAEAVHGRMIGFRDRPCLGLPVGSGSDCLPLCGRPRACRSGSGPDAAGSLGRPRPAHPALSAGQRLDQTDGAPREIQAG